MAEDFKKRNITYRSDTLPALSGLAQRFCEKFNAPIKQYVGLWSHELVEGLLWIALSKSCAGQPGNMSTSYIAPSWSWVNASGPIQFN